MSTDELDAYYDERFELLANARRRFVLYYLYRQRRHVPVDELARAVADTESLGFTSAERVRRTRRSLTTTHLPRLSRAGLVISDGRGTRLTREALRRGVLGAPSRRPWWQRYHVAVGVLVWAVLVAAVAGLEPLASLPWQIVALVVLGLVVGSASLSLASRRLVSAPAPSFELLVE
jgi:hypothetical protein